MNEESFVVVLISNTRSSQRGPKNETVNDHTRDYWIKSME